MSFLALVAGAITAPRFLSGDGNVTDVEFSPASAEVTLTFNSDGSYTSSGNVETVSGDWVFPKPSGVGSLYEIRATETTGTVTTGTIDFWSTLASPSTWSVEQLSTGSKACTLLIEIHRASDGELVGSASFVLTASVESGA